MTSPYFLCFLSSAQPHKPVIYDVCLPSIMSKVLLSDLVVMLRLFNDQAIVRQFSGSRQIFKYM
jgi:hypothetical protein